MIQSTPTIAPQKRLSCTSDTPWCQLRPGAYNGLVLVWQSSRGFIRYHSLPPPPLGVSLWQRLLSKADALSRNKIKIPVTYKWVIVDFHDYGINYQSCIEPCAHPVISYRALPFIELLSQIWIFHILSHIRQIPLVLRSQPLPIALQFNKVEPLLAG